MCRKFFFIVLCFLFLGILENTNAVTEEQFTLKIIHINDFHSRYDEINSLSTKCKAETEKCIGGYARIVSAVKMLKAETKFSVYLNAGDNFQGTLWYDKLKGNTTSYFLNLEQCDAMTLGNHEFDDGVEGVVPFLKSIESPVVVCNIDDESSSLNGLYEKSIVLSRGTKKIGIIGVLTAETPHLSRPGKVNFLDEIKSIKSEIVKLKEKRVDIIIVLSHCGLKFDRQIAQEIGEDIHVIVGGHSHSLLYNGVPSSDDTVVDTYPIEFLHYNGNKTLIVQALAFSKFVGNLTVYFGQENEILSFEGNPVYMDDKILKDQNILDALKPFQEIINEIGSERIGTSKIVLEKNICSVGECSYGNFINDAYVDYYVVSNSNSSSWTSTPIALSNAGIIRVGLNKGNITFDDLATSHPYENTVDTFDLRGDHLMEALEISASNYNTTNFLHFSGLKIIINLNESKGKRVKSIKVRCAECRVPVYEKIDRQKYYRIAIASWIGDGGNGYLVFKNNRKNLVRGPTSLSILERYLRKVTPIVVSILDQRIIVEH